MGRPRVHSTARLQRAAALVLSRDGVAELTLEATAATAGVSPATLSKRFRSKRRLLMALADDGERVVEDAFERLEHDALPPLEELEVGLLRVAATDRASEVLTYALAAGALDDPGFRLRNRAIARADRLRREVLRLVRAAVARHDLVPLAATRAADEVLVAFYGALLLWRLGPRGPRLGAVRRNVRAVLRRYAAATSTG